MRRWSVWLLIGLVALLAVVSVMVWQKPGSKERVERALSIQGSTTVFPIVQRVAEEFMGLHPKVEVTVRGGGSGVGIAALLDGTIDIAMSSRPMKAKELERAKAKGIEPVATVIARDGIAVIVHPTNPVNSLRLSQIRAIYTGRVSRWSEVGGRPEPIVVISRDVASGTFETFKSLALKGAKVRDDALMLASNQTVIITVAQTPGAIGYVGLGYLSSSIKALEIDGVYPRLEIVRGGRYPLVRPLFLYTHAPLEGLTKEFINFLLSPTGQNVVEGLGFVPVR